MKDSGYAKGRFPIKLSSSSVGSRISTPYNKKVSTTALASSSIKKSKLKYIILLIAFIVAISIFSIAEKFVSLPLEHPTLDASKLIRSYNSITTDQISSIEVKNTAITLVTPVNKVISSVDNDVGSNVDNIANEAKSERKKNVNFNSNNGKPNNKNSKKSNNKGDKPPSTKKNKDGIYEFDVDPPPFSEGKYIELYRWFPGSRTGIRRDRIVNLSAIPLIPHGSRSHSSSVVGIPGKPQAYINTLESLHNHPFSRIYDGHKSQSLVDVVLELVAQPQCKNMPIFTTMATVGEDLYWQLIENFMYSMVRFNVSDCAFVICVSDSNCMDLCDKYSFPCFDYRVQKVPMPSVMEQIAIIKLVEIPKVLKEGASVFMLDLDVGFLESPMIMIQAFRESPKMDIFVQEDMIFIMNRTKAGWKQWSTQPLANIGLFLCRGNERTVKVFDMAWEKYKLMEKSEDKANPGKDQNHVLDAMRYGRFYFDLKYAYFTNRTAMLMDKVFKFDTTLLELGGEASSDYMSYHRAIVMHSTCYEHVTKVMGLKATNAFWHPRYYDPLRPTITKQLIFITIEQLLDELRALVWLGIVTGRSVIVPNILGSDKIPDDTIEKYKGQRLWPGFRVLFFYGKSKKKSSSRDSRGEVKVNILEPGFYWRVHRDYEDTPEPEVVSFSPGDHISGVLKRLSDLDPVKSPRVVLHATSSSSINIRDVQLGEINKRWGGRESPDKSSLSRSLREIDFDIEINNRDKKIDSSAIDTIRNNDRRLHDASYDRVVAWSKDSVGLFSRSFAEEVADYGILPSAQGIMHKSDAMGKRAYEFVYKEMRTCQGIFSPLKGNRTCFQICE